MIPSHYVPTRVVYEDPAWKERRKLLLDFCEDIRQKAELIPYSCVRDDISRKLAGYLTHPTTLKTDRWTDVMAKLGFTDQCLQGELLYFENWRKGEEPETAFFLFLTRKFAQNGGTLWQVIDALSEDKYTDVMENIQNDISEFVATYTPETENKHIAKSMPPDTLDSGVGPSFSSSGSPQSHQNRGNFNFVGHVQSPARTHDFLISPQKRHVVLDYLESLEEKKSNLQEHVFWPKPDPFPSMDFANDGDEEDNFDFRMPFENAPSTKIKVFIPHTDDEVDEEIAEEVSRRLENEYHFKTYLLKNMSCFVDLDVGHFVMKIMERVDFLVPVLSRSYLQEIVPVGDTNEMSPQRLVLRYIHATSQTRVINRNSLNYLIRPIIVDGVNYGMVRKWHEFQSALKYPKDLGRLARNLTATKEFMISRKYGRQ